MSNSAKPTAMQAFLRGIESDLRALCADARRRNQPVKAAAEAVILKLKEADDDDALLAAADAAARAFSSACNVPSGDASTAATTSVKKLTYRSVACMHKMLTHTVVSPACLTSILAAIERVGVASFDDNITLKVLQTNISLLTVRRYARALSEPELARAFALFFRLRTSSVPLSVAAEAAAAGSDAPRPLGVIETTARAAFRQVAADLFASALEAHKSVNKVNESVGLDANPIQIRASYRLFQDLCALLGKGNMRWLSEEGNSEPKDFKDLPEVLILEVVDDALSGNVDLFRRHPLFSDLVSAALSPVILKMELLKNDKAQLKALSSLNATVVRNFSEEIGDSCKEILLRLTECVKESIQGAKPKESSSGPGWIAIFSLEALRCIFSGEKGPELYCQFILAYDLAPEATPVVRGVLNAVAGVLDLHESVELLGIPLNPMLVEAKPFYRMPLDSYEVLMSIALGLFISFGKGVGYAAENQDFDAVRVFAACDFSPRLVAHGAETTMRVPIPPPGTSDHIVKQWMQALENLTNVMSAFGKAAYTAQVPDCLDQTLTSLSSACILSLQQLSTTPKENPNSGENNCGSHRALVAYSAMFSIQEKCGERLGRNWGIVLNALVALDERLYAGLTPAQLAAASDGNTGNEFYLELKKWLEQAFARAHELSWNAVQELVSALIHSSRAAIQVLSKRPAEESSKSDVPVLRMFGITWAEAVVSSVIMNAQSREDNMPQGLWELLTGHHVSICVDSGTEYLRTTALKSLSRVASVALACNKLGFVPHGKIISPFMDLLQSPYAGTRSDTLESLRLLLQTHGDKIEGIAAWGTVLSILRSACGRPDEVEENGEEKIVSVPTSDNMVSDGFRVVQLIADDFLPCLVEDVLPRWMYVIGGYGRQRDDVNVALTSIELLWSTADYIATVEALKSNDMLWITLFSELKDIGHDERPEIRNCAVKTLTGTLTAHAANLSANAWEGIIASALLPLLERVMRGGEPSNEKNGDEGATVPKSKVDQQLIVHHSRNTPRKQWNETRVLALRGVASVLCIAIPLLADLRYEDGKPVLGLLAENEHKGLWNKVLQFAKTAAASQDGEVAVAGVASLLDLLDATGKAVSKCLNTEKIALTSEGATNDTAEESKPVAESSSWISGMLSGQDSGSNSDSTPPIKPEEKETDSISDGSMQLWESVWQTIASSTSYEDEEGNRALRSTKVTDEKALVLLGEGLSDAKTHFDPALSHKSSPYLLQVLFHLVTNENTETTPEQHYMGATGKLSDVALSALNTIQSIRFGEDADSWKCLLKELVKVLDDHSSDGRAPVATFHVVTIMKDIYSSKDRVPVEVLNEGLLDCVCALGRIMTERHRGTSPIAPEDNETMVDFVVHDGMALWSAATIAFETAMHTVSGFKNAPTSFWDSIAMVLDDFLYPTFAASLGGWGEPIPFGARPQAQEYDILLARCIRDFLPFLHAETLAETRERLVELLARGAEEGKTSRRPRFVRACQEYIFNLADQRWVSTRAGLANNDIANICARKVTQVSDIILQQFIADGQRAGRCPLPAERRAEVMFLMRKLRNLQAYVSDPSGDSKGAKRHMLTLYPRLAECVDVGDIAVRNFARALIDESTFKQHILQQMPVA